MTQHSVLRNDELSLAVAPLGAEMQYLRTAAGDDFLWRGDPEFWSGRAPVLFPIVGRAVDDIIAVGSHTASMAQHGFARRSVFTLDQQSDVMCRHVLCDDADSRAIYPFSFTLHVTHRLDANALHVTAQVTNASSVPMPFGFGFHPAFCWPLPGAENTVHHITLAGGGAPRRQELEDGLLRHELVSGPFVAGDLALDERLFKNGALVFPNGADALSYVSTDGPSLKFNFLNLPDLALWRPANAPFLCVEPWHGTASYVGDGPQIAQRPNSIILAPDDAVEFGYSVEVIL